MPQATQLKQTTAEQAETLVSLSKNHSGLVTSVPREGGGTLAQAAQSSCGCPIPGSAQGQAGRGWEQPGLAESVPAPGRGVD